MFKSPGLNKFSLRTNIETAGFSLFATKKIIQFVVILRSFNIKYSKFFLKDSSSATTCPTVYSNIQVHTGRYRGILYIAAILSQFYYIYLFCRYSCFTSVKYSTNIYMTALCYRPFFLVGNKSWNIIGLKSFFCDRWLAYNRAREISL